MIECVQRCPGGSNNLLVSQGSRQSSVTSADPPANMQCAAFVGSSRQRAWCNSIIPSQFTVRFRTHLDNCSDAGANPVRRQHSKSNIFAGPSAGSRTLRWACKLEGRQSSGRGPNLGPRSHRPTLLFAPLVPCNFPCICCNKS